MMTPEQAGKLYNAGTVRRKCDISYCQIGADWWIAQSELAGCVEHLGELLNITMHVTGVHDLTVAAWPAVLTRT